jgi:hypothetical protein
VLGIGLCDSAPPYPKSGLFRHLNREAGAIPVETTGGGLRRACKRKGVAMMLASGIAGAASAMLQDHRDRARVDGSGWMKISGQYRMEAQ